MTTECERVSGKYNQVVQLWAQSPLKVLAQSISNVAMYDSIYVVCLQISLNSQNCKHFMVVLLVCLVFKSSLGLPHTDISGITETLFPDSLGGLCWS